jgi:hypothetical protein
MRFNCAVAVWSLQHVADPLSDLAMIKYLLKPGGRLFVLNADMRFVPTSHSGQFRWSDDGADVWGMLRREFVDLKIDFADRSVVPAPPTAWGVFEADSAIIDA